MTEIVTGHNVQQYPQRINVYPVIALGYSILLWRRKARCAEDNGIFCLGRFIYAGRIKVNQYRSFSPNDHIFRLDVPVDDPVLVEKLQRIAELKHQVLCFASVKADPLQQKRQRISLNIFLQHRNDAILLLHLIYLRKMRTGDRHKPSVYFCGSVELQQNIAISVLLALYHIYGTMIRLFHRFHQIKGFKLFIISWKFQILTFYYAVRILIYSGGFAIIIRK